MKDDLLRPLDTVLELSDELLASGELNDEQTQIIQSVLAVVYGSRDFVVTMPDHFSDDDKAALSYEMRSGLNTVIGYTEMLLDGSSGPLGAASEKHVLTIRSSGRFMLGLLARLLNT
jgi:signal transduction histidine kinase